MNRAIRRGLRTLAQLIAGGGLTALVVAMVSGMGANSKALVLAGSTLLVTFVQNLLEGTGKIPILLPAPVETPPVPATTT